MYYNFKGKKRNGEWVYGDLLNPQIMTVFSQKNHNDKYSLIVVSSFINGGNGVLGKKHWVLKETVCTSTNMFDKNGQEIFLNDILNVKMSNGEYEEYIVEYDDLEGEFTSLNKERTNFIIPSHWKNCEVIGNKFDL